MGNFFVRLLAYTTIIICLYMGLLYSMDLVFNKDCLYKINNDKTILIVGNSHTSFSINDSLLDNVCNLSQQGDPFDCSYIKLKKILPLNPNIHTVVMSCSEGDITQVFENERLHLWASHHIQNYFYLMPFSELFFIFAHNPKDVIITLVGIPKSQLSLCYEVIKRKATLKDLKVGGYEYYSGSMNLTKELKKQSEYKDDVSEISLREIDYLHKVVLLCKSHNVKIIFIRPPEHKLYVRKNEDVFLHLLREKFNDVPFKDYVNMAIPDSCFYNMDHLNHFGANIFTDTMRNYFNTIVSN